MWRGRRRGTWRRARKNNWMEAGWTRAAPVRELSQQRYGHWFEELPLLRAPVRLPGCWQALAHPFFWPGFVSEEFSWGSASIFFLLGGSHTVVGFPHFCGTAGNCGCKASKGHRQYRSPSQLSPSLWQKLSAISLLSPSFSARAGMLFWICTSRAMKAIDLLKQTPRPQAK